MSINDIEKKIEELKAVSKELGADLTVEIEKLEQKLKDEKSRGLKQAWNRVQTARHKDRPRTQEYIDRITDDFIELHGDRRYADDKAIVAGIGLIDGMPVTIIGHQKGKSTEENIERNFGMPNPEGYRKALRLMKQAEKFKRPVITFIDTPGAYCGLGAEERGQAQAIAENLLEMSRLKTKTIAVVIGEGGSGGALALAVSDKIAMLENSVYSVISPEGLASILWKDAKKAPEASEVMKLTAKDLHDLAVIDDIIEEPEGGAHNSVDEMSASVKKYIVDSLKAIPDSENEYIDKRYKKIRSMGKYFSN